MDSGGFHIESLEGCKKAAQLLDITYVKEVNQRAALKGCVQLVGNDGLFWNAATDVIQTPISRNICLDGIHL